MSRRRMARSGRVVVRCRLSCRIIVLLRLSRARVGLSRDVKFGPYLMDRMKMAGGMLKKEGLVEKSMVKHGGCH
jgi:hypothetical protein